MNKTRILVLKRAEMKKLNTNSLSKKIVRRLKKNFLQKRELDCAEDEKIK